MVAYAVETAAHLKDDVGQIVGDIFGKSLKRGFPVDTETEYCRFVKKVGVFIG